MTSPDVHPVSQVILHRAVAASAIGNATEWFDYGIYAYGVTYISAALFPGSTAEATLFALATFAISFLVRPLGGIFWGLLGDRYGRKTVLVFTLMLMAGATFCIGLVPTYDQIGVLAPAALVVLRMAQGFSTGGEYSGAATFMAEYSPDDRRGYYGSFLEVGTLAGFSCGALLMLGCALLLGDERMHDWGWRLPFMVSAPLGLVGLYLRSRIGETPVFREIEAAGRKQSGNLRDMKDLFGRHWRPLLTLAALVVALNIVNYTLLSYMPTYLQLRLGLSSTQALYVPIIGMLSMIVFLPFVGALSDRIGRKPLWRISLAGLFVCALPAYHLMASGLWGAIAGFAILGLLYVPQLATISATFPAMFPTPVRLAGLAIAYNMSTSLFGGTAPAVNSWLISQTGNVLIPAYVMMAACVVGLGALPFLAETAGQSLRTTGLQAPEKS